MILFRIKLWPSSSASAPAALESRLICRSWPWAVTYHHPAVLVDVSAEPRHLLLSTLPLLLSLPAGRELTWQGSWFPERSENAAALGCSDGKACTGALTLTSPVLFSVLSGLWATMATEQSPPGVHSQPCQSPTQLPSPRHPLAPHTLPRLSFSHPF